MELILSGNKEQMYRCQTALIETDGDFNVEIVDISIKRTGLFKHELIVNLDGNMKNIKRFNRRVNANYLIAKGNVIGLLDYRCCDD